MFGYLVVSSGVWKEYNSRKWGWLSALLQGRQEADRTDKGNLPIQDLVAFTQLKEGTPTVPVSLKLLSPKTKVEGSYTNLVDALFDEENFNGHMYYVVARKLENHITIEGFDINRSNFIDLMTLQGGAKGTTKLKGSGASLFEVSDRDILRKYGIRNGRPATVIDFLNSLAPSSMPGGEGGDYLNEKAEAMYDVLIRTSGYTQLSRKLSQFEKEKQEADQQGQEQDGTDPATPESRELMFKRAAARQAERGLSDEEQEQLRKAREDAGLAEVSRAQKKAIKRFSEREMLLTESSQTQWTLSTKQIEILERENVITLAQLGELPKTREKVIDVAVMHMDTVREKFMILFKAFADLNENINKYITFPKRDAAIKAGERAIDDTGIIQREIQDNVQADESAVEDDLD